ncbi:MAG: hypothetical protein ABIP93_02805 [Gemmatimonadaceae bacterium]
MTARRLIGVCLVGALASPWRMTSAQRVGDAAIAIRGQSTSDDLDLATRAVDRRAGESPRPNGAQRTSLERLPAWSAPLASLVLPGLGQARLRQGRAAAYLAAESFLLLQYRKDLNEGRGNERDYREIARTIARRGFAPSPPDTVWQYYEKLSEYVESGAFSMVANGPTLPESDPLTYNGFQWLLARQQFGISADPGEIGSPQYGRALALYESRAMRQPYRWSWRNAQLEKDLYVRAISRTNDAYRRATFDLSALIANHLLSAIDAFAVVRLSQGTGGAMRVSASLVLP